MSECIQDVGLGDGIPSFSYVQVGLVFKRITKVGFWDCAHSFSYVRSVWCLSIFKITV